MLRSSLKFSGRALPALTLLAGILVGFVSGCSHPTTTSEAEPEAAPQEDSTSASTISSNEIRKRPHEPIESLLEARFAGVRVSRNSDGSIAVRIRGAVSFLGSSEPLYVIDGIPIRPGPGGSLSGINPYDIESIQVLKHPPATTLYGVRGANGVILITTKRPDQ